MELTINGITSDYWIDGGLTLIINSASNIPVPTIYSGSLVYAPFGSGTYYLYMPGTSPVDLGNDYYTAKAALYILAKAAGRFPIP